MIRLPALPYPQDALAPHISERTMGLHYGKHHAGYVANLNKLLTGGAGQVGNSVGASGGFFGGAEDRAGNGAGVGRVSLETLITTPGPVAVFNNAAQIWNHTFYWRSMSPDGGGDPSGELASAITSSFGSVDTLRDELTAAATRNFASGWTWLVSLGSGAGGGGAEGSGAGAGGGGAEGAGAGGGELGRHQHQRCRQPAHERAPTTAHDRHLGTRLLPRLPERSARLHRHVPRAPY